MELPALVDESELDVLMADVGQVTRCLDYATNALGVEPMSTPVRGSALVGIGEQSVLKLMPPFEHELAATEHACLRTLDGALPIATPSLLASGSLDGWNYVHMSRLAGVELKECWPTLSAEQRLSIATQLGECLHVLHRLPAPADVPRCDWPAWTDERVTKIQHSQRAAPSDWVDRLPRLLASADTSAHEQGWLHTEIMLEHLLVSLDGDRVCLSGLFDFEPSWVGPRHYEYASVALFVSAGDSSILAEVMRAAGESIEPERLFAMAILHRYGRLGWYKERLGGPQDLDAWIQTFFGSEPI